MQAVNVTVAVFTTYWKSHYCCNHCSFSVNECQQLVYTHTSIYSNLILFYDSKYVTHSIESLHKLQGKRLVTMSVSLHTQTGSPFLTGHVLNTRTCFLDS